MSEVTIELSPLEPLLESLSGRGREALLPALHEAQAIYGWLPPEVQEALSFALRVPLADIHGVIEFYTMFYAEPMARRIVRVCEDPACSLAGAADVAHAIETQLGLTHGETAADGAISYETVPCLGMCEMAPCALDGERPAGHLTVDAVPALLDGTLPEPALRTYGGPRWILRRAGRIDPLSLDAYVAHGGYRTLPQLLSLAPDAVIDKVEACGIFGRGGAQFPLGRKWRFTRGAPGAPAVKHIVCNADESEPGTFKDRNLMEGDPFALIEAMTIAAYAIGAENGWIFIRGEYPKAYRILGHALDAARAAGYLGRGILGQDDFNFDIEIRLGAGAYICGEETALFEAIEGKRGFPRIKPPFPTTHGLFGQPTAINNVETLVAMLVALSIGVDEWRSMGTEQSPGTKLFCLSGNVTYPGVYEIPFGLTFLDLIHMAGGIPDGNAIQAVLVGGAAGAFIGPEKLDTPLTYEDMNRLGIPLGSGVVMVFDEEADLRRPLYELTRFFAHESCGKCFPCQLGTQRQMEVLARVMDGDVQAADRDRLHDLGHTMAQTSLCGLGQTAASAVISAIDRWPTLLQPQVNGADDT